jgi:hypothetical protein
MAVGGLLGPAFELPRCAWEIAPSRTTGSERIETQVTLGCVQLTPNAGDRDEIDSKL